MRCVAVIPARYGSSRLPGKPLADLLGKPMIQHVVERVSQVRGLSRVIVATDDVRIVEAVHAFGGDVMLTRPEHRCGTDRLVEVQRTVPADVYLNVQGDEPLVDPAHLQALLQALMEDHAAGMGSLCHPISAAEAENPNAVKVVVDHGGRALYFSRAKVPFVRADAPGAAEPEYLKHVGVYAYRAEVLARFAELPPSPLEALEMLEQLRPLQAGIGIRMVRVGQAAPGVDTPACLETVRRLMAGEPAAAAPTLADVRLVITDVDGVLTDGALWYGAQGEAFKRFHVRDGLGIKLLQEAGVEVAVVSGRDSPALRTRIADLGIRASRLGVKDKAQACHALMAEHGVPREHTACLGDDSIDLPAFEVCGWPVAVPEAPAYVRRAAKLVLAERGGHGAFREFADALLSARGRDDLIGSAAGYARAMHRMAQ